MQCQLEDIFDFVEIAMDEPVQNLQLDTHLYEELGMDSIGAVAMVVEIQRRYGVRLPEELIPTLMSPSMYIDAINTLIENTSKTSEEHELEGNFS